MAVNSGSTYIFEPSFLTVIGTNLYAGGVTGLWRRPLSQMTTSVEEPIKDLPIKYSLSQNYPNPFNPTTNNTFRIPQKAHVALSVFNILGQRVATLVNRVLNAGPYRVTFDGNGLASGVYIYRLKADNFVVSKKLLLLK